jgi:hypothetical protein
VYSCNLWLNPTTPPLSPHLGSYKMTLLVSQDLFVTPLLTTFTRVSFLSFPVPPHPLPIWKYELARSKAAATALPPPHPPLPPRGVVATATSPYKPWKYYYKHTSKLLYIICTSTVNGNRFGIRTRNCNFMRAFNAVRNAHNIHPCQF